MDWYDNGPGSESFKRSLRMDNDSLESLYKLIAEYNKFLKKEKERKKSIIDLPEELFEI